MSRKDNRLRARARQQEQRIAALERALESRRKQVAGLDAILAKFTKVRRVGMDTLPQEIGVQISIDKREMALLNSRHELCDLAEHHARMMVQQLQEFAVGKRSRTFA